MEFATSSGKIFCLPEREELENTACRYTAESLPRGGSSPVKHIHIHTSVNQYTRIHIHISSIICLPDERLEAVAEYNRSGQHNPSIFYWDICMNVYIIVDNNRLCAHNHTSVCMNSCLCVYNGNTYLQVLHADTLSLMPRRGSIHPLGAAVRAGIWKSSRL